MMMLGYLTIVWSYLNAKDSTKDCFYKCYRLSESTAGRFWFDLILNFEF